MFDSNPGFCRIGSSIAVCVNNSKLLIDVDTKIITITIILNEDNICFAFKGFKTHINLSILIVINKKIADIEHDDSKKNKNLHIYELITIGFVLTAFLTTIISCKNFETIVNVSKKHIDFM